MVRREVGLARNKEERLERALVRLGEEKSDLEKENTKLNYQIGHLKRSIRDADAALR